MGAIKSNNYTENEQELFLTARAFAHPARIKMMKMMLSGNGFRNIDLCAELNLTKRSVKNHIEMFKDAKLIEIEYFIHYYKISLNEEGQTKATNFLG